MSTVIAYISCDLINGQNDRHILVIHHSFTWQLHQAAEFIIVCNQRSSDKKLSLLPSSTYLYDSTMKSDIWIDDWWQLFSSYVVTLKGDNVMGDMKEVIICECNAHLRHSDWKLNCWIKTGSLTCHIYGHDKGTRSFILNVSLSIYITKRAKFILQKYCEYISIFSHSITIKCWGCSGITRSEDSIFPVSHRYHYSWWWHKGTRASVGKYRLNIDLAY